MQRSARWLGFLISVTVTSVLSASAQAQVVGAKPITVIVPYATGGATDVVARMVAQQLGTRLGTPVIVENRQGGGGVVGHVLVINPAVPAKNIKELIALAKAEPGKLNFGSGGTGTNTHLGGELLKAKLGISMTHVPYRGAGAVLADLMAGQVQVLVSAVSTTLPLVQAGKLRALMMLSDKRSDVLPDVPTAAEEGFPGLEMNYWVGFAAPQGTPQAVVDKLNQEINAGLLTPESQKRLKEMAFVPVANTPAQAAQLLESEINRWSTLIKQQGIQAE